MGRETHSEENKLKKIVEQKEMQERWKKWWDAMRRKQAETQEGRNRELKESERERRQLSQLQ
jgi:hypothetical protein